MRHTLLFLIMFICTGFAYSQTQVGGTLEGEGVGDHSGFATSISQDGTKIAVGARRNDDAGSNAGSVRVYQESGGVINQIGGDIDGESSGDRFGYALDLSSNLDILVVGARENDDGGNNAGSVRVFDLSGGAWVQRGLDIDGTNPGDLLGTSVSINSAGTRIAIGVPFFDSGTGTDNGCVRIYDWDGSSWSQYGTDIVGASGDQMGTSVSMSNDGSKIIIGSPFNDAGGNNSGAVLIFEDDGSAFAFDAQINGLDVANEAGFSVDISGDGTRVVFGEPKEDTNGDNSGAARVFEKVGMDWSQAGQTLFGRNAIDRMGHRVSIDENGDRIGLGSPTVNSNQGLVQVYEYNGTAWGQLGADINGQAAGDRQGGVAISGDGQRVLVSGWEADGSAGLDSGEARLFGGAPLPIELISFEGRLIRGKVEVIWYTGMELDNKGFEVQRSADGRHWEYVGFVEGAGQSQTAQHYLFTDESPLAGISYYRLKQLDYDGDFEYSPVITIQNIQKLDDVIVSPNPAELGDVQLSFNDQWGQNYEIELVNQQGAVVYTTSLVSQKGQNQLSFDFSHIPVGVYTLRLVGAEEIVLRKLIMY